MAQRAIRTCTKCLESFPLDNFYSKGKRTDSRCKACVKSTKKTKYVTQEQSMRIDSLYRFFELVTELEVDVLRQETLRLDREILKCQEKKQQ